MSWVRLLTRLLGLKAATMLAVVSMLLSRLFSIGAPDTRRRWRWAIFRRWSRQCLRVLGGRVVVEGSPPSTPFFLVANHLSYVDIIALASGLDTLFVAKSEIAGWPVFGYLCRIGNTIFIHRGSKRDVVRVARTMLECYRNGEGVTFFPEGTSSAGAAVLPFRTSLLSTAAEHEIPVHAAAISYRTPAGELPAHLAISWWGDMLLLPHAIRLLRSKGFEARVCFGSSPVADRDRKRLAQRLQEDVSSLFTPTVEDPTP